MNQVNRRYIVTLALAATAILVVGSLLRPQPITTDEPVPRPSQAELSRLARLVQRRSLDSMREYFGTVAGDADAHIVRLPSLGRSGLVWETGLVLTARTEWRFPDAATLSTPTGDVGVAVSAAGPHLPIAAVRMSDVEGFAVVLRRQAALLEPGAWTIGLWRHDRELRFTPAHFLGIAPTLCEGQPVDELLSSVAWTQEMAGGGLFDLDGRLIAVIIPCVDRFVAADVDSVQMMLRQGQTLEGRLLGRYGLRLGMLTESEREHFGSGEGVVIREVWTDYLADVAGLFPGDILLAINAEPIGFPDQLEPLVTSTEFDTFDVAVRRAGTLVRVQLPTDPTAGSTIGGLAGASGLVWTPPAAGYEIGAVVPNSQAHLAGIRAGDRLLRIDGNEPEDLTQVQAALSATRDTSTFIELERHGRRWGVLLPARQPIEPTDG